MSVPLQTITSVTGRRRSRPAHRPSTTAATECHLVQEMRRRWSEGDGAAAEEFFQRHPELWDRPEEAIELIYEEFCQRQAAGDDDAAEKDILLRFPQWDGPLRVMLDCHRQLLRIDEDSPQFPNCGDRLADFQLIAELSRGAHGRVFLAHDTALSDRRVVLKITPFDGGGEHLSLARLQHTNIVPLYSVVNDPQLRIRVLCMPCFGRATLAALLSTGSGTPRSGQDIVEGIDRLSKLSSDSTEAETDVCGESAARQMLRRVSFVQAICWISAALADALQFAHERGVVHLDLKPSNVLLSTDGQPMLLDFHLARPPLLRGGVPPENFGGTIPYMAPEQRRAMQALQEGTVAEDPVDARADIYAMGAMIYESLGGTLPIAPDSLPLSQVHCGVSTGLSDIVARCVLPCANDRYASAAALADDLRRHLTDQPLSGVANRSINERLSKWRRRRPTLFRGVVMLIPLGVVCVVMAAAIGSNLNDRVQQARIALHDGEVQFKEGGDAAAAVQTIERGLAQAQGVPFHRDLQRQLQGRLTSARRLHVAQQVRRVADDVRALYGVDQVRPERLSLVRAQCTELWKKREMIAPRDHFREDRELSEALQEVAIFVARTEPARDDGIHILAVAGKMFPQSPVIMIEQRRLAGDLAGLSASNPAAQTPWEHYAVGRALLAAGNLARAGDELSAARKLDPAGRWSNFYYGLWAYRTGRYAEATTSFSVAIGTAPRVAQYFYNRALAYAAMDQPVQASGDFDRARELDRTYFSPSR